METITHTSAARDLCVRSIAAMRADSPDQDLAALLHPQAFNHEQRDEPPAARGTGPQAWIAVKHWLNEAFADLDWDVHHAVAEGDLVVVHCTMRGRHVRPFVSFDADARVAEAFPPTGRTFASTQTHWFRVRDGLILEHWANRDDLGTAAQLGWVPPSPRYLLRMALAKRRARRRYAAPATPSDR